MAKKLTSTEKLKQLSNLLSVCKQDRNVYVVGCVTNYKTDTLVPAYRQIMDLIEFVDKMITKAIIEKADKLYFECYGDRGICRCEKNGKLIREYPFVSCLSVLNHIMAIFRLDRGKKRIPRPGETYKIISENGTYLCRAVPLIMPAGSGEDVIINFYYDYWFVRTSISWETFTKIRDFLNKGENLLS